MTIRTRQIAGFSLIALVVAIIDFAAKEIAELVLAGGPLSVEAFGRGLRLVLTHNELSAFGLSVGSSTREINVVATAAALLIAIPACDKLRIVDRHAPFALGLIAGAALGNLMSMLTNPVGVVDFIAIPTGGGRELVFNLADIAAYAGLVLLSRTGFKVWRLMRFAREVSHEAARRLSGVSRGGGLGPLAEIGRAIAVVPLADMAAQATARGKTSDGRKEQTDPEVAPPDS